MFLICPNHQKLTPGDISASCTFHRPTHWQSRGLHQVLARRIMLGLCVYQLCSLTSLSFSPTVSAISRRTEDQKSRLHHWPLDVAVGPPAPSCRWAKPSSTASTPLHRTSALSTLGHQPTRVGIIFNQGWKSGCESTNWGSRCRGVKWSIAVNSVTARDTDSALFCLAEVSQKLLFPHFY